MKKSTKLKSTTPKRDDVPVSVKMLNLTRDELKSATLEVKAEVREVRAEVREVRAEVQVVQAEVQEVRAEVSQLRAGMKGFDAKLDALDAKMDSRLHGMQSELHRIALLVEEQNARNVIVLDGLSSLFTRQTRVEDRQTALEKTVLRIK